MLTIATYEVTDEEDANILEYTMINYTYTPLIFKRGLLILEK